MTDESRKLLKVFGVTVTDFEAEAEKLSARAAQLGAGASREEVLALVKDTVDSCREMNQRWLEITRHVFAIQDQFLAAIGDAAKG
jgi:hypothetical protein